jgi:hypothetical protein
VRNDFSSIINIKKEIPAPRELYEKLKNYYNGIFVIFDKIVNSIKENDNDVQGLLGEAR